MIWVSLYYWQQADQQHSVAAIARGTEESQLENQYIPNFTHSSRFETEI